MTPNLSEGLQLGSSANPVIIKLTVYEGHRLLDIRKYFVPKTGGAVQPTKKGISLGGAMLKQVYQALQENMREIGAWLDKETVTTEQEVYQAMSARLNARQELARQPRQIDVQTDTWQSPNFYKVESIGGKDKVSFNNSHPIFATLGTKPITKEALMQWLGVLLVAHHRAKAQFPGDQDFNSDLLFEEVEFEWGKIAANYAKPATN